MKPLEYIILLGLIVSSVQTTFAENLETTTVTKEPVTTPKTLESTTDSQINKSTETPPTIKPPDINATVIAEATENIPTTTSVTTQNKESSITRMLKDDLNTSNSKPSTCSGRVPSDDQPQQSLSSRIKKCCPVGEYYQSNENGSDSCVAETLHNFEINVTAVTFYNGCIEDNETFVELDIEAGNPCNISMDYGEAYGDKIYVMQNGSLLVMDKEGVESYEVYNDYCLDMNSETGQLKAVVCITSLEIHIGTGQTIINGVCMLFSIPCLFFVCFIHFAIKKLRTLHGMCIGSLAWCLAIGFTLHSICQLSHVAEKNLQYAVQYFILAYFLWLLVLCINIVLFLWGYLLNYIEFRKTYHWFHFTTYFLVTMTIPLTLVLVTKFKRIPGMPSYFYQGWSESIRSAQRYFIPPVSGVLILCFILLVVAFFGTKKLDEILNTRQVIQYQAIDRNGRDNTNLPVLNQELAEEVKLNTQCIAIMYIIVVCTWLLEVITFYSPGAGEYLAFLDVMNALQGVFILIIFVVIRKKREVIASWWHDRGSHQITPATEMTVIQKTEA